VTTQQSESPGPSAEISAEQPPVFVWNAAERKTLILFLLVAFVLPLPLLFALQAKQIHGQALFTVQSELLLKSITAFFVVLATWLVSRRQQRPLGDYGIPPSGVFGARFWEGAVWGFVMLSALLLILHVTGHFEIQSAALAGRALYGYAFAWALGFFFVGISEEFSFRGYLLFLLARRAGFWRAAVGMSVGFAVAHLPNPGETLFGILQVFAVGLFFCFTIRRTGNLWFAVGFHSFWDWAQTFFYGTPDSGMLGEGHFLVSSYQGVPWISGGSAGPEGSVFALLIILLAAFLVHLRFPDAVYPDRPR
jgi:membrane protease YdiL (CAAX protease family)